MKKLLCLLVILGSFSGIAFSQAFFTPEFAKVSHIEIDDDSSDSSTRGPAHIRPSSPDNKGPAHVETSRPRRSSKPAYYHDFSTADSFFELFIDLFFFLSVENNLLATFDYYPYATSNYYVQFLAYQPEEYPMRWMRFNIDAGATYHPGSLLIEPNLRFEGYLFKFFGPIFENNNYIDFQNFNFYSGNFKLGLEYAILQTFIMSLSFSLQWNHYYGGTDLSPLNGLTYGIHLKSYPIKPLVLDYHFYITDFFDQRRHESAPVCDTEFVFESILEAGVMLGGPVELYGNWKYIRDGLRQEIGHNFGLGLKYYF